MDGKKRGDSYLYLYLIAFIIIIVLNFFFLSFSFSPGITAKATSSSGNVQLTIEHSGDVTAPIVYLISPADLYLTTETIIIFNYNTTDTNVVDNCSLIIDNSIDQTDITITRNIVQNFTKVFLLATNYTWGVNCTDSLGNEGNSSTRTITISEVEGVAAPPTGAGGGGGGGGFVSLSTLRSVEKSYNIYATVGIMIEEQLTIVNTGDSPLSIKIELANLKDILFFKENELVLKPRETKTLEFNIIPPKEPGIYVGRIVITSGIRRLEIPLVLNVKSEKSLFDVSLDIPENLKIIDAGEKITSQITLIQKGAIEKIDVTLNYVVKDFRGKVYSKESKTMMVEGQASFVHEFDTERLRPGEYIAGVEVVYIGGMATASSKFTISGLVIDQSVALLMAVLAGVITIFVMIVLLVKRYKKDVIKYRTIIKKRKR